MLAGRDGVPHPYYLLRQRASRRRIALLACNARVNMLPLKPPVRLLQRSALLLFAGAFGGLVAGWLAASSRSESQLDRVIVMSWGDGRYGPAFYGAHVWLEPIENGYSVRARVLLGRGNRSFYDVGELGQTTTDEEAVARWGEVRWRDDGLQLGTGVDSYFLPRAILENHR